MLPPRGRLTKSIDFQRVHGQGRSWSNRLAVLCRDPNDLPVCRVGFSVSRRIGGAVVRNRVRRLMREAVRTHYALLAPGWDVVFIARKGILGANYGVVEAAVLQLLRMAQLLRAPAGATAPVAPGVTPLVDAPCATAPK